jgi:hypothetical protein
MTSENSLLSLIDPLFLSDVLESHLSVIRTSHLLATLTNK